MSPSPAEETAVATPTVDENKPIFGLDFIQSMQLPSIFPSGAKWFLSKKAWIRYEQHAPRHARGCDFGQCPTPFSTFRSCLHRSTGPSTDPQVWTKAITDNIDKANAELVVASEQGRPDQPPTLICIGFPTVPQDGRLIVSNELWSPPSENEATVQLKPGNFNPSYLPPRTRRYG
jgi:hypothetical protein